MKRGKGLVPVLLFALAGMLSVPALYGQSLAELARQERARKAQEGKETKVYTNSDIRAADNPPAPAEAAKPEGTPAGTEAAPGEAAAPKEGEKPAAASPESQEALEKEYRDKFAKLRETVEFEERKLDVMQREFNLMQMQYYGDPNVALREQTFRTEINQRTQDIEAQKLAVEKAKQAIADLEEELRKKGLPPGWGR